MRPFRKLTAALLCALLLLVGCSDAQDIEGPILVFPEGEGFAYPMRIVDDPMALNHLEPTWIIEKDGISIGYACRYTFEVPFSEEFLDDPTTAGVGYLNSMFVVAMDSWTYDLNDGWVCYLFAVEHAGHGEDRDDVGYGYEALVGRPGESQGFNISWAQFLRPRDMERKLILEPGDPGYVSFEEVQVTVEALKVR